jgi:hypothetical protein
MSLRPILFVGVGGSGGKALRAARYSLQQRLDQAKWTGDFPEAWQFVHIDTPASQPKEGFDYPLLPSNCYVPLVLSNVKYVSIKNVLNGLALGELRYDALGWMPAAEHIDIDLQDGASQYRALGRAVSAYKLNEIKAKLRGAANRIKLAEVQARLGEVDSQLNPGGTAGGGSDPLVIVVSSISGGTGSGIYLDVIEALKSASTDGWSKSSISFLFTPDVFREIGDGLDVGIAPNALAAMSESMSGLWNVRVGDGTRALYDSQSLSYTPPAGSAGGVGSPITLLIGAANKKGVAFPQAKDVYAAAGSSLAAIAADSNLQEQLGSFVLLGVKGMGAAHRDDTNLTSGPAMNMRAPFLSIGFGRVSIGRDRFANYASQRLAFNVINRLLNAVEIEKDRTDKRGIEEISEEKAKGLRNQFAKGIEFHERGREQEENQIVDKIRPDFSDARASEHASNIVYSAVVGQSAIDVAARNIIDQYLITEPKAIADETALIYENVRKWVAVKLAELPRYVMSQSITHGINTVLKLIDLLIEDLGVASKELKEDAESLRQLANPDTYIRDALQGAPKSIDESSAVLTNNIQPTVQWLLETKFNEKVHEIVSVLVDDIRNTLLPSMKERLNLALQELKEETRPVMEDGSSSEFMGYPKNDGTVPSLFSPTQNEFLLVEIADYETEFKNICEMNLVSELRSQDVISGTWTPTTALLQDVFTAELKDSVSIVTVAEKWGLSRQEMCESRIDPYKKPKFNISAKPSDFVTRAHSWLYHFEHDSGTVLYESLSDYLEAKGLEPEKIKRHQKFRIGFSAAVSSSAPLIDINTGLMQEIHGLTQDAKPEFSILPFSVGSKGYEIVKEVLMKLGLFDTANPDAFDEKFNNASARQYIEIVQPMLKPFQPVVVDSIMKPIADKWGSAKSKKSTRDEFWKWRRTRSLPESIPMAPNQLNRLIRGWFVGLALNEIRQDAKNIANPDYGVDVDVWGGSSKPEYLNFPYPLLDNESTKTIDILPGILKSLPLALVEVNQLSSLGPLLPYHRLIHLGRDEGGLAGELVSWIERGTYDGPEQPMESRAGNASGKQKDRIDSLEKWFTSRKNDYIQEFTSQPGSFKHLQSAAYEIRREIYEALDSLVRDLDTYIVDDFA